MIYFSPLRICNYADDNSLLVSPYSTEKLIYQLGSAAIFCENMEIKTNSKTIEEVKKGKLLGITFDDNITMNEHIKTMCKQASNKLNALTRIAHFLNEKKKKLSWNRLLYLILTIALLFECIATVTQTT